MFFNILLYCKMGQIDDIRFSSYLMIFREALLLISIYIYIYKTQCVSVCMSVCVSHIEKNVGTSIQI